MIYKQVKTIIWSYIIVLARKAKLSLLTAFSEEILSIRQGWLFFVSLYSVIW